MFYIYETQNRPDGVTNLIDPVARQTFASGASYYYSRCSTASANTNFVSVAVYMMDNEGNRILPRHEDDILIPGAYVAEDTTE